MSTSHELGSWPDYPECPDCNANAWELGPRGGASVNIRCTFCGARFNAAMHLQLIQRLPARWAEAT